MTEVIWGPRKAELLFGEKEAQRSQTGFAHLCVKPQSEACADASRSFKSFLRDDLPRTKECEKIRKSGAQRLIVKEFT